MPPPHPEQAAENFFRPGGELARGMPAWEERPGQAEMAAEVAAAVEANRNLIVEAGTGTGKTLAYLVPLILAGKRAVVSTGTKNLQDQLVRKDMPLLETVLRRKLDVAVMKGRSNFLCLQKLAETERKPALQGLAEFSDFARIREWGLQTRIGDRNELDWLAADSTLWPKLDARREACSGKQCPLFEDCFVTKMHQRARRADIIVVNHHLFFADLARRQDDFGPIIPQHQAVVFDEAHEIEQVAGHQFGAHLSNQQFEDLARDVQAAAKRAGFGSKDLDRGLRGLRARARDFFALFDERQNREVLDNRREIRTSNAARYTGLVTALEGLRAQLGLIRDHSQETDPLRRRAGELKVVLRTLLDDVDEELAGEALEYPMLAQLVEDRYGNYVYWLEKLGRGVHLQATPIDVSPILEEALFALDGSAILASATLAVNSSFEYIRSRLGLRSSRELAVPGEFDYENQVLLYIPRGMPPPQAEEFGPRAVEEIVRLVRLSQGRAFVLFTSRQQMRRMHQEASLGLEYPCLVQGQAPNAHLLERFRKTENCVLFATASFWQGVDVPGEQLSCVIVDKLPFAVPSDPIVGARIRQIREAGGSPFHEYQVPGAVLALKQGFGRLIRSTTDRGVLALLDSRIVTKQYGRIFLDSLPPYRRTNRLEDVEEFFGAGGPRPAAVFRQAAPRRRRRRRALRGR